jgi:hypothetical protein
VFADREQVLPVAGRENVGARLDGAGEDRVVSRIIRDRVDPARWIRPRRRDLDQKVAERSSRLPSEAELLGQHALQLVENEVRQEELDAPVERLLEQAGGWPARDQR